MNIAISIARMFLGAFLLVNGLNFWIPFLPITPPENQQATDLMNVLVASGLFGIVKYVEIGTGLMLLLNRFVPLALLLMLPLTVVIMWVDMVLINTLETWVFALLLLLPQAFLMLTHLRYYLDVLRMRTQPDLPDGNEILDRIFSVPTGR